MKRLGCCRNASSQLSKVSGMSGEADSGTLTPILPVNLHLQNRQTTPSSRSKDCAHERDPFTSRAFGVSNYVR